MLKVKFLLQSHPLIAISIPYLFGIDYGSSPKPTATGPPQSHSSMSLLREAQNHNVRHSWISTWQAHRKYTVRNTHLAYFTGKHIRFQIFFKRETNIKNNNKTPPISRPFVSFSLFQSSSLDLEVPWSLSLLARLSQSFQFFQWSWWTMRESSPQFQFRAPELLWLFWGGISRVLRAITDTVWRMPGHGSKPVKQDSAKPLRRDPYEVLGVSRNSTDQEIKSAYRRMALKYVGNVYLEWFFSSLATISEFLIWIIFNFFFFVWLCGPWSLISQCWWFGGLEVLSYYIIWIWGYIYVIFVLKFWAIFLILRLNVKYILIMLVWEFYSVKLMVNVEWGNF